MNRTFRFPLAFILIISGLLLLSASPSLAARNVCQSKSPSLDLSKAASVPSVEGGNATTIGQGGASSQAATLTSGSNFSCSSSPSAQVKTAITRATTLSKKGNKAAFHSFLKTSLSSLKKKNPSPKRSTQGVISLSSVTCPDQKPHISIRVQAIVDYLAIAREAFLYNDNTLGEEALSAAQDYYKGWAIGASGAQTVGDWLAVEKLGQTIGLPADSAGAYSKAIEKAKADVAQAKKADKCTMKKAEFDCITRTVATLALLGEGDSSDGDTIMELAQAIVDRSHGRPAKGCEDWDFTLTSTSNGVIDGPLGIDFKTGRFRVNRDSGTVTSVLAVAPSPKGWDVVVGSGTAYCEGYDSNGALVRIPGAFQGGTFHYLFSGSLTGSTLELIPAAADADVKVTMDIKSAEEVGCGIAAWFGQGLINGLLNGGLTINFDIPLGQTSATFQQSDADGTTTATIKRVAVVAP